MPTDPMELDPSMEVSLTPISPPSHEAAIITHQASIAEVAPRPDAISIIPTQERVGTVGITADEAKALCEIDEDEIAIRPDGLIYAPQEWYRRRLNEIVGAGQWGLRNVKEGRIDRENDAVFFYHGVLYIRGEYVSEAIGEMVFRPTNQQMSWVTAREGAKSDCLTRCCKDLGLGLDMWNRRFGNDWKAKYAVRKRCVHFKSGEIKYFWRRKDDPALYVNGYKEQE